MSRINVRRRGRALASLTAAMGLCLSAMAVSSGSAQSAAPAAPAEDCTAAFPVAEVAAGDAVTSLSVTEGTTPQEFQGKVLGVLQDGIAPGLDMVMVQMTPPSPDDIGGIWQGMSGSPVYAADGRLIGAVAYGLSWGPSWVAGVTPFEDMDDYLGAAAAGKVAIPAAMARTIAAHTDVTAAQAQQGARALPMPLGVSGVKGSRLSMAQQHRGKHAWLPKGAYKMGASAAPGVGPAPETVVAGGNLAASLSYGDVTQAGVGTATSVCHGKVVGFGHPMSFLGETTLALHPADVIYVQQDSLGAPFKVANLGAPAGTVNEDHLTGITGVFGSLPDTTDVSSSVTYRDRARTGESHVSVPSGAAATTFYELVGNHDRVVDGTIAGSELQSWSITGHEADGSTFGIDVTDRYASDYDITFDSAFEVADFVYSLSAVKGVTIDAVTLTSDVDDDNSTWKVSRLEQKVHGAWSTVGKGAPVVARAGKQLVLRALLTGPAGTRFVPVSMSVPRKAAGTTGQLTVLGGSQTWSNLAYPRTVSQAEKYADTLVRNDQVLVGLNLVQRRSVVEKTRTSQPLDKVVYGHKRVKLFVTK